jgi:hypothetical protein
MASIDNRLEKLESELAEQRAKTARLEAEIAGLRGARQAVPNSAPEEEVKIFSPRPANGDFVMPSGVELARLHELVCTRFPSLRPQFSRKWAAEDERQYVEGFTNSFRALGHIGRAETVYTKHYLTYWQEHCEEILRSMGKFGHVDGLLAASIAHGDICYRVPNAAQGIVAELGLLHFGSGRLCKNKWRDVLNTGQLLPPAPVSRPQHSQSARVFEREHA